MPGNEARAGLLVCHGASLAQACVKSGKEKKVQDGGRDKAAKDDDSHGVFNFMPGFVPGDDQRHKRKPCAQGGHEDGGEALLRTPQE